MTTTTSRDAGTPVDRTTRPSLADLVPTMVPRLGDYWRTVYRRTWRGSVVTSFLMPFLYLTAMGVGLGSFVDDNSGPSALDGVSYLAYIAPGLLATFVYAFLFAWDELLFVSSLTQYNAETIPLGIRTFISNYQQRYDQLMAAGVVSTVPVMIAFFATQRWLVRGLTAGSVKG